MTEPAPFFIGYSTKIPGPLLRFGLFIGAALVIGFATLSLVLGTATDDPGSGTYIEEVALTGTLLAKPYPLLELPPDASHRAGHTVLLAGDGKTGVEAMAADLAQRTVAIKGARLKRGDLDMIVVAPDGGLSASDAALPSPAAAVPLGQWRITGEICDGKCYSGAMHPGTGLAHKACANLCIGGGVPPVLVSTAPVDGTIFLLLSNRDGGPSPPAMFDLVARPVSLDGDVVRLGDLLIFDADWSTARTL